MENISIAGSGRIASGEYGKVQISGSGSVGGAIRCESFSSAGSCRVEGDIESAGKVGGSGSFRCDGSIRATEVRIAGSGVVMGDVKSETVSVAGAVKVVGGIHAEEFRGAGATELGGDIEAERVQISGRITMPGLLNAETVEICTEGYSKIGSIGGTEIRIKQAIGKEVRGTIAVLIDNLRGKPKERSGFLQVNEIEGDVVELNGVESNSVRGRAVVIHADTRIGRVEYSESLQADEGAYIGEAVKVE